MEGVSSEDNEICLEVTPENLSRALKTVQNAKAVKVKLTRKHCPCLTIAAELVRASEKKLTVYLRSLSLLQLELYRFNFTLLFIISDDTLHLGISLSTAGSPNQNPATGLSNSYIYNVEWFTPV